jgi:hypothetical protein
LTRSDLARYYDPATSRWAAADNVTTRVYDPQSLNKYAYVRNDPVNLIDRDGRSPECLPGVSTCVEVWASGTTLDSLNLERLLNGINALVPQMLPVVTPINKGIGVRGVTMPITYKGITFLISKNNLSGQSDEMITCIAYKESRFSPWAKSASTTASGLMQVTKGAAADVYPSVSKAEIDKWYESGGKIFDPSFDLAVGSAYLGIRVQWSGGDIKKALAGYGTQDDAYAESILDCEKGLKSLKPGESPDTVLSKL